MKKQIYIIICVLFLIVLSFNINNDRYHRIFLNESMKITNESFKDQYMVAIYGDETNACSFAMGPGVYLNKGEYAVTIHYQTDTNKNFVNISSKINGEEVVPTEEESCLYYEEKTKIIYFSTDEDIPEFNIDIEFAGTGFLTLGNIEIENVGRTNTDTVAVMITFIMIFTAIGMIAYGKNINSRKEKLEAAFALIIITIASSYIFFGNSLLGAHDISYHLCRIEGIKSGLLDGQFPVRIHSNLLGGYGYASSMFYPELFLYIPAILRIFGVSLVTSVQLFFILINFMTAFFMYMTVFKISGTRYIGMISSTLYVLANYHLCDIYTRFALGEVIAMVFLPLVIYGVYELVYGDETKWIYLVFGITGVLQSHILSILFTIPLIVIVCILCIKKLFNKNRIIACFKAILSCVLLNIWFIVPFLQMMKEDISLDNLERNVAENALTITQLFQTFTKTAGARSIMGTVTGVSMPLHIGFVLIIAVVLALFGIISENIQSNREKKIVGTIIALGILTAYATTYIFPWENLQEVSVLRNLISKVQFPWRLLAYTAAFFSIAGGYGIYYIFENLELRKVMVIVTIVACSIPATMFLDDVGTRNIVLYRGEGIKNTNIADGEYLYKGTNKDVIEDRGELIIASSEMLEFDNFKRKNGTIAIDVENSSSDKEYVEVPLLFYPGYVATLNSDTRLNIEKGTDNVLRVNIPADSSGTILIKYRGRLLWDLCTLISILTLIVLITWKKKGDIIVLIKRNFMGLKINKSM